MLPLDDELARYDAGADLAHARTLPAAWYLREDLYQHERLSVFARTWQAVGRAAQVERPGEYFAGCACQRPYVVLRDQAGALRAWANVCRHHAAEVVQGCGQLTELVCPYHGWTYSLDGRLRRAPKLGAAAGFDPAEHSLLPLGVALWGPLVCVNWQATPIDPCAEWAAIAARVEATGWNGLAFGGRQTYELACNWKVYVDNYLDGGYHVEHIHPALAGQLALRDYRTELFERCSIQSCAADTDDARLAGGAFYAWAYPNLMLNRYGPVLDVNWVEPLAVDRTRVVFDFYFAAEVDDRRRQEYLAASEQVQREDMAICESVQRGLASGAFEDGPYAAAEAGMHQFHRLLATDLRSHPAEWTA